MTREQRRALQWAVAHSGLNGVHRSALLELIAAGANSEDAAVSNSLADSPLVKKYRRDCWLRNHAYERAARTCEAILAFGFVGDESADRFEWTAKECARIVRQLKDHEEFANKHEENDD